MPLAKPPVFTIKRHQPTLTDAARLAGVSPMTVSRVVNGNPYVSTAVRRKVERILDKLEYSPNKLARSLKGRQTTVVGVLLPDLRNPFSVELARGIDESLSARGYYSFVISGGHAALREKDGIQAFSEHRVAGAILAMPASEADLPRLARDRFPVVVIGPEFALGGKRRPAGDAPGVDRVTAACRDGGRQATAHLIEMGRRRIAFIGSHIGNRHPGLRFKGYLDALAQYGIHPDKDLLIAPSASADWCSDEDGYLAMRRLLDLPCPPDAVFARNDCAAIGALRALHEHGVRVPGDIALAGFDNISISAFTSPALTTVDQFVFEQGKAAARLLLDRLEGPRPRRRHIEETFPCRLVIRQSTALKTSVAA